MIPLDSTATSPPDSLGGTVSGVPLGAPWPSCDFDADRSIGYTVLVSGFVMLGLALMLLALRLYARLWVLRKWGADDIFMTLAAVLAIVRMNFAVQGVYKWGIGRHMCALDLPALMPGLEDNMTINTYLQMATNMLIKCAVLQQLARIAGKESQKRFWLMGAALLIVVQNCIFFGFLVQKCAPRGSWRCPIQNDPATYLALMVFNLCTDVGILSSPLFVWGRLRLIPGRQRCYLLIIPVVGTLPCVFAALTIYFFLKGEADPSWGAAYVLNFQSAELHTGIILGCAVCLGPLITHFMPSITGWEVHNRDQKRGDLHLHLSTNYGDHLRSVERASDKLQLAPKAKRGLHTNSVTIGGKHDRWNSVATETESRGGLVVRVERSWEIELAEMAKRSREDLHVLNSVSEK